MSLFDSGLFGQKSLCLARIDIRALRVYSLSQELIDSRFASNGVRHGLTWTQIMTSPTKSGTLTETVSRFPLYVIVLLGTFPLMTPMALPQSERPIFPPDLRAISKMVQRGMRY